MNYIWRWGKYPAFEGMVNIQGKYKDSPCEVVARGTMNSALIRFPDGKEFVLSRNGLRRAV